MEIRIFYKIYFNNEENEENINKKSYYFIKESICEKNHQLTIEQIKNIIFKDGFNSEYKDLIQKFKYRIIKKDEEPKNILNKNDIQLEDMIMMIMVLFNLKKIMFLINYVYILS